MSGRATAWPRSSRPCSPSSRARASSTCQSRDKAEKLAEQLGGAGPAGSALSCRARAAGPRAQPGRLRRLRGDGDGRDHRLRHGHRQARRALRRPCRHPQVDRGLLSGDRPRRPRRRAGRGLAVLGRRGFRPRPPADRDRGRGEPPRRRARAAERARHPGRDRRLPPRDPAPPFRRGPARDLRQLRQLPRAAGGDRRHRRPRRNCSPPPSAPRCASASAI